MCCTDVYVLSSVYAEQLYVLSECPMHVLNTEQVYVLSNVCAEQLVYTVIHDDVCPV